MKILSILLLSTVCAFADECPPDRPIAKRVYNYPTTTTCTLMMCWPKLHCPPNGGDCVYVANDCNKCSPEIQAIDVCLSQQELDEATRPQK